MIEQLWTIRSSMGANDGTDFARGPLRVGMVRTDDEGCRKIWGIRQLHGTGLRTDECSATRTWLLGQARKGKGAKVHDGQHEAIIDEETWARVQQLLEGKAWNGSIRKRRAKHPSPLVGKLFDDTGDRLTPSHATKQGVRYRYYISNRLMKQPKKLAGDVWRLPAPELEKTISNAVADHLRTATMAGPG
jgi:hypothetical protein